MKVFSLYQLKAFIITDGCFYQHHLLEIRQVPNKPHHAAGLTWEVYWEGETEATSGRRRREKRGGRENAVTHARLGHASGAMAHVQRGRHRSEALASVATREEVSRRPVPVSWLSRCLISMKSLLAVHGCA